MIIKEAGAQACIDGNWKNNKYTGRCVDIPDDPAAIPGSTGKVQGEYVNLPGGAWKGSGTCIYTFDGGDELHESWEEGSHLKAYKYTYTGGKGKYAKAKGGGTYTYTEQADLQGGRYNGTLELP